MIPIRYSEHAFYLPVGPLKYFLMDDAGAPLLGLYRHVHTKKLVLMATCFSLPIIIEPDQADMEWMMKDRKTIRSVLLEAEWTHKNGQQLTCLQSLLVRSWINLNIPSTHVKELLGRHYPNYFYEFANSQRESALRDTNAVITTRRPV